MTFNPNIPTANQLLSDSQPILLNNNQALDTVFGINHYKFSLTDGSAGKHKSVEMPQQGISTPTTLSGEGTLFTRTLNSRSQLCYTNDNTGNVYQLTRAISPPTNFASANGWSFLPGGLLIQWGSVNLPGSGPSGVFFPTPFTGTPYTIQFTARNDGSHSAFNYYLDGPPNNLGFQYRATTGGSNTLFWIAIGA